MLQYRPDAHVPAMNALLGVIDDEGRRFREALGVTLDMIEPEVGECAARRVLETLLRIPSIHSRIATQLNAFPSEPAEVADPQDASDCAPEGACLDLPPEAGDLFELQQAYDRAQHDLFCADMIDNDGRRRREMSDAQKRIDELADRIETLLERRS